MKIVNDLISKIGIDKILHFLISAFLVTVAMSLISNILVSALIVLLIGIGKELYDKFINKTEFSVSDLIADVLGIGIDCILIFLIVR